MALIDVAIEGLKTKSIDKPAIVVAPTREQIAQAEAELEFKFPPDFLIFLEKAGSYAFEYWETYWVGDESLEWRNIVKVNRSERENADLALPAFLVAFHNDGCGNLLCFDTRQRATHGDYPIVFWDHERTADENLEDMIPVANTFSEWLMQEVGARD
jgi:hypothetical protein